MNTLPELPPLPPQYKPLQHYLKTAAEHESRDSVVAYYCRLYTLQRGMAIDKTSPECRHFLMTLMDLLEKSKQSEKDTEAVQNEVVGQAHVEHYALQIFLYADNEDRAGRFGRNVVKSFYMAVILFEVLTNFGELSEDIEKNMKYARWKAAYIHRCLKAGETPVAGPLPQDEDEDSGGATGGSYMKPIDSPAPDLPKSLPEQSSLPTHPTPSQDWQPQPTPGGVALGAADYEKAMKYCKYAGSALQYEDSNTAITNLNKALKLLTTGHE